MRVATFLNVLEKKPLVESSRLQVFFKIGVIKNFTVFVGKHMCLSLFFNKVAGLKKRLQHRFFPVNIVKCLKTAFFIEHFQWLLLTSRPFWCNSVISSFPDLTLILNSSWSDIISFSHITCSLMSLRVAKVLKFFNLFVLVFSVPFQFKLPLW